MVQKCVCIIMCVLFVSVFIKLLIQVVCYQNMYRLHHEVEVGMGFTQPRAEGPRIV